jgi:hypothetical protein
MLIIIIIDSLMLNPINNKLAKMFNRTNAPCVQTINRTIPPSLKVLNNENDSRIGNQGSSQGRFSKV